MAGMDRTVFFTLFFALFATVTGVGIVVPLLPVYAHQLGAGGFAIGMIFGAFSLSRSVFMPLFGRQSDRVGRKPFIVTGLAAYAATAVAFMIPTTVWPLIGIRFFQGIASAMLMPVIQAYIGDLTPAGREGGVMGLFNVSLFMGLSAGPAAGGVIQDHWGLHAAFTAMGLLALVGVALSVFLLPPRRTEIIRVNAAGRPGWRILAAEPGFAALFGFRFSYAACIGVIWGFLPVLAATTLGLSSSRIGVLIMLGVLTSGLLHAPLGQAADRLPKKVLILTGGLLVTLATAAYCRVDSFGGMVIASIVLGLGGGIAMPTQAALAVIYGHRHQAMGAVMGLLTWAHSLGMLAGALVAGLAMDVSNLRSAFGIGAAMMALALVVTVLSPIPRAAAPVQSVDTIVNDTP